MTYCVSADAIVDQNRDLAKISSDAPSIIPGYPVLMLERHIHTMLANRGLNTWASSHAEEVLCNLARPSLDVVKKSRCSTVAQAAHLDIR